MEIIYNAADTVQLASRPVYLSNVLLTKMVVLDSTPINCSYILDVSSAQLTPGGSECCGCQFDTWCHFCSLYTMAG